MDISKNSQQTIKEHHLKLVFSLIHENNGISRADIKKKTNLSATTVSTLVDELILKGVVIETGAKNTGTSGRRAISLSVNKEGGYFAVITVSGRHFRLRTYDMEFEEVSYTKVKYNSALPLSETVCSFLSEGLASVPMKKLCGIAVGVPAIVDDNNKITSSTVLHLTENDDIYGCLKRCFPTSQIAICNISSLIAYAEKEFGEKNARCLVSVDINDGVGAAAIIDGVPYKGSGGMALEFGHISVDREGEKCRCGFRGCIETVASKPVITQKCREILSKDILFEEIPLYAKDNTEVQNYLRHVASLLGFAINNLINIMDPDAVIICGEIIILGDEFLEEIKKEINSHAFLGKEIPISYSSMRDKAEFKGGAKYIFDCLYK